jgi:hypothetical protein
MLSGALLSVNWWRGAIDLTLLQDWYRNHLLWRTSTTEQVTCLVLPSNFVMAAILRSMSSVVACYQFVSSSVTNCNHKAGDVSLLAIQLCDGSYFKIHVIGRGPSLNKNSASPILSCCLVTERCSCITARQFNHCTIVTIGLCPTTNHRSLSGR